MLNSIKKFTAIAIVAIASATRVQAGDMVPAKITFEGKVLTDVPLGIPMPFPGGTIPLGQTFRKVTATADGVASHMGVVRVNFSFDVYMLPDPLLGLKIVSDGTYVITSANGDVRTGNFMNVRIFTLPIPALFEYTGEAWGSDGSYYSGGGWLTHGGDFRFEAEGFVPNKGQLKKQ